ncbi:hypothetical protein GQ457_04G023860 [Hibiscus cannabinus]
MYPKDKTNKTWHTMTYVGEHNCVRDTKNMNCTFRWLAKEYLEIFRVEPNYSVKSLKYDVMNDHMVLVQRSKCIRAKKLALEMILGNQDEQYARIYDYLGHYQGWLLAAVGIDANDCIYPLAFAVVESETRDSWT